MIETDSAERVIVKDEDYQHVVRALVQYTSMPFLELVALTPVKESKVGEIIEDLERKRYVTIHRKGDLKREIVTVAPRQYDSLVRELYF